MTYDLLIIGAGPAGITAGIYAKRANLKVAVIENEGYVRSRRLYWWGESGVAPLGRQPPPLRG